ncbi:helix-turn-helix domain-containing protein [Paenibacillus sp. FSL H8-0332]|uniref:helix-turn-helix domain-containing protein n=1 Tax=Paenibacillus sp. FSL H8-0332 TaxID=2954742 RepID=UPI0030CB5BF1
MQKKIASEPITNNEFLNLLQAARNKDSDATLKLLELYKPDILRLSRFIYLPEEDVTSEIVLEFLEIIYGEKC